MSCSGGVARLYVNGMLQGERAAGLNITNSGPLHIGANRLNNAGADAGLAFAFRGQVREVGVWNVARSGPQISEGMSQCIARAALGLVVHLRFSGGSGTVVRDVSGSGNDAVVRNGATWTAAPPLC